MPGPDYFLEGKNDWTGRGGMAMGLQRKNFHFFSFLN